MHENLQCVHSSTNPSRLDSNADSPARSRRCETRGSPCPPIRVFQPSSSHPRPTLLCLLIEPHLFKLPSIAWPVDEPPILVVLLSLVKGHLNVEEWICHNRVGAILSLRERSQRSKQNVKGRKSWEPDYDESES